MAIRSATLPLLLVSSLLAGCWSIDRPAIQGGTASAAPAGDAPGAPPKNLGGKWTLAAPGADSCAMNFTAPPDAIEGTIAPDRGCPFNFFTSRKWSYTAASLIIHDHNALPLARLSPVGPDRYEGRSSDGQEVTLSRQ
jgi:Protease inhibitor Inh